MSVYNIVILMLEERLIQLNKVNTSTMPKLPVEHKGLNTIGKVFKALKRYKYLYIMLIPVLIWYIVFRLIPMTGLVVAFTDYNMTLGVFKSPFVGFKHFAALFNDPDFWIAFWNTVIIAVYRLIVEFPIPIIIAIMLNEVRNIRYRKTIQTIIYLPHFLSWVIVASLLLVVFSPETGIVAAICSSLNIETPNILINAQAFRGILIWSDVWKEAGWNTIIYVAAMASIDPNLYEAARVDGANRWHEIKNVTIPSIFPVIVTMLILMIGSVITWGFDQVYNLYNPMVYETGDILDTYIIRTALGDYKFSYGAAAGIFKSAICIVLMVTANKIARRLDQEGIY